MLIGYTSFKWHVSKFIMEETYVSKIGQREALALFLSEYLVAIRGSDVVSKGEPIIIKAFF